MQEGSCWCRAAFCSLQTFSVVGWGTHRAPVAAVLYLEEAWADELLKIPTRSVRCYLADSVFLTYLEVETQNFVVSLLKIEHHWNLLGKRICQWKWVLIHSIKAWISASPNIEVAGLMWMWLASAMRLWWRCLCYAFTIFWVKFFNVYSLTFCISCLRKYICSLSSLFFLFNHLLSAKQLSKEETEHKMVREREYAVHLCGSDATMQLLHSVFN